MKKLKFLSLLLLLATAVPLLQAQTTESFTFTTNRLLPDGNAAGLSEVRNVRSAIGNITSLNVRLKVTGEFNGDLYGYVRHASGFTVLLNRPGKTILNTYGYGDSGINVTFYTGATNGDLHVYHNVTTPEDGSPLMGVWEPDNRSVDPAIVADDSVRSTSLTNFNGLGAAGDWTLYLVDVDSGATNMLTEWGLDITGVAGPALAWSNPADIVYGTTLSELQLNATATYNEDSVPGTLTYSPEPGTVLNAGPGQTLSVTFTPTDTNSFTTTSTEVTINVLKAGLTVTAESTSKVFGAALPAFTATYDGFVFNQGTNDLTTPAGVVAEADASSDVGSYSVTASGAVSSNYSFNYVEGSLTITPSLTTGTVLSSANPALPGASVTFTMTVTAVEPGAGTPTGMVNFRIDGNLTDSATLSEGVATITANNLALASHTIAAEYAGDQNFAGTTNSLAQNQIINTPPVAGNDAIERYSTRGVKVRLTTLLVNDGDADGNDLVIAVNSNSASNGTITESNGWVFYMPTEGFTNADSFTYTITDGRGGSALGAVTVAINANDDPGQNLTITSLGNGAFRIDGSGVPERTYRLQYSDTLISASWQDLPEASVTADLIGAFEFIDTTAAETRYYRSVFP